MKNLGSVVETFSATKDSSGLPRPKTHKLELIEGFGIQDDKFAGKDLERTVMIIGENSYSIAKEHNIDLALGSFGENILLDFDPHTLDVGAVLVVGGCEIEISEKCTICSHLSVFGKDLPKLIATKRGLYCKILQGGTVEKNQKIFLKDIS